MSPSLEAPPINAEGGHDVIWRDPLRDLRIARAETERNHAFWARVVGFTAIAGGVYGGIVIPIVGFLIGLPWAGLIAIFMALPFVLAVRTLTGRWRHPWVGPAFGGVVGFVATYPAWTPMDPWTFVLAPMATTLFGQLGGYLAVRRYWPELRGDVPWRFSLRTMLVAMCWAALILGIARGAGLFQAEQAKVIGWWLPWQALLCIAFIVAGRGHANRSRSKRRGEKDHGPGDPNAARQIAFHVKR